MVSICSEKKKQVETDVESSLETYAEELGDAYTQYSGTDKKGKQLFKLMFEKLDLGPAPETTINQPAPQPGINPDPQTALNAMPGTPKEKSMIARALNAMAGEKLLTESASFYTNMERQAVVASSQSKKADEQSEEGAEKKSEEEEKARKRIISKLKDLYSLLKRLNLEPNSRRPKDLYHLKQKHLPKQKCRNWNV